MPADSARATRAVFDVQIDEPHGRRRRPAPDWGGDDLFDHVPRRRFSRTGDTPAHLHLVADPVDVEAPAAPAEPSPVSDLVLARRSEYELGPSSAPPGGRRTVTITGRPGPAYAPRRGVEQRITHRPDHVAALACALGVLLVIIALLS
jgi:hypothetical protein